MHIEEVTSRLGLPKHSGRVFEALENESHSVRELEKALGVHRPALYRALEALGKAKLVRTEVLGKRAVYRAFPRARLSRLFQGAALDMEKFAAAGPEIVTLEGLQIFEGEAAVREIFESVLSNLKRSDTFFRYTSEKDLDAVNALLPRGYRSRRDAKRLERLVISNVASGKRKKSRLERFIKFLGSEREPFDQNVIQLIYGSRVAFIDLNTFTGFIFNNKPFADFHATIFRALYRRL